MFQIEREELKRLDERVFEYNGRFASFYIGATAFYGDSLDPSPECIRLLSKDNDELRKALTGIRRRGLSEFDRLVYDHLRSNLSAQRAYLNFYFLDKKPSVDEFIAKLLGNFSMDSLAESYDDNIEARLLVLEGRRGMLPLRSSDERVQHAVRETVPELLKQMTAHYAKLGLFPGELVEELFRAMHIRYDPEEGGSSWWKESYTLELAIKEFNVYQIRGRSRVNPSTGLINSTHEILGHTVRDLISEEMPRTLTGDNKNFFNLCSMQTIEGYAFLLERFGEDYVRNQESKLSLEVDARGLRKRSPLNQDESARGVLRISSQRLVEIRYLVKLYLSLKGEEQSNINEARVWRRFTGVDFARYRALPNLGSVTLEKQRDLPHRLSYWAGIQKVRDTIDRVKASHEDKSFFETPLFNAILSTGTWSWEVFGDWLRYAVAHKTEFEEHYALAVAGSKKRLVQHAGKNR